VSTASSSRNGLIATSAAQTGHSRSLPWKAASSSVVPWCSGCATACRRSSSADIEALAGSVPDSGGVVFVPAFTGLGAPYWQPDARGAILGLSRGSSVAHIARAALESIAFQSAALLQAMLPRPRRQPWHHRTARRWRRLRATTC
jgi:glycerol kinase